MVLGIGARVEIGAPLAWATVFADFLKAGFRTPAAVCNVAWWTPTLASLVCIALKYQQLMLCCNLQFQFHLRVLLLLLLRMCGYGVCACVCVRACVCELTPALYWPPGTYTCAAGARDAALDASVASIAPAAQAGGIASRCCFFCFFQFLFCHHIIMTSCSSSRILTRASWWCAARFLWCPRCVCRCIYIMSLYVWWCMYMIAHI